MSAPSQWRSGKDSTDENFPVASVLVARRHRPAIMAFYRFARAADDAADHPTLAPAEKRAILDRLEATLHGDDEAPDALPLRAALAEREMAPTHALDLLTAFRQDVDKSRYATFGELMDYCAFSAMPVGRFVLDVHGEARDTWPASDALCAALQIINHLQDCAKDYRALDRCYLPAETLARHGGLAEVARKIVDALLHPARHVLLISPRNRLQRVVVDELVSLEDDAVGWLCGVIVSLMLGTGFGVCRRMSACSEGHSGAGIDHCRKQAFQVHGNEHFELLFGQRIGFNDVRDQVWPRLDTALL